MAPESRSRISTISIAAEVPTTHTQINANLRYHRANYFVILRIPNRKNINESYSQVLTWITRVTWSLPLKNAVEQLNNWLAISERAGKVEHCTRFSCLERHKPLPTGSANYYETRAGSALFALICDTDWRGERLLDKDSVSSKSNESSLLVCTEIDSAMERVDWLF